MTYGSIISIRNAARSAAMLALLIAACATSAAADPFAILAGAKGTVEVTLARGGAPARASFGRELDRGDKVTVGAGGGATIYFSDGNVIELGEKSSVTIGGRVAPSQAVGPAAALPAGVFASVSRYVTKGSRETGLVAQSSMRGGGESPPLLLAPRKTDVLEDRPAFSWRAAEGATRYRVTLSGDAGDLWSRESTTASLNYPADAPALARDADYLWRLEAFGPSGSLRTEETLFRVVSVELQQTVVRDLHQIEQNAGGADHPAMRFLSGSYLFDRGMYRDAAGHFEALARLAPTSPAPHEALGNVYRAIGLMDQAAAEYQKALELTKTP
jgi:hypothetical protein